MQALLDTLLKSVNEQIPGLVAAGAALILLGFRWLSQRISVEKIVTQVEQRHVDRVQELGLTKLPGSMKKREAMAAVESMNPLTRPWTEGSRSRMIEQSLPKVRKRLSVPPPAGKS